MARQRAGRALRCARGHNQGGAGEVTPWRPCIIALAAFAVVIAIWWLASPPATP